MSYFIIGNDTEFDINKIINSNDLYTAISRVRRISQIILID